MLGGVIALAVVAALVLAWLFDPNDYKGYVERYVKERTGRDLELARNLNLSFFPWLAVETGGITLGNAPGFETEPFATVEHAAVRVRLLPLLAKRIEIGTIVLDGVTLNLAVDASGRGNWEDLTTAGSAPEAPEESSSSALDALESLDIAGLVVRNAEIDWRENIRDLRYRVSDLSLETGPIALGAPVGLRTAFDLADVAAGRTLALTLEGELEGGSGGAIDARGVDAKFELTEAGRPNRVSGRLQLASLEVATDRHIETGTATVSASLAAPPVGPDPLGLELAWSGAVFDPTRGTLEVQGLSTHAGDVVASWELAGRSLLEQPEVTGSVRITGAPLASVLALLSLEPPAGSDAGTLGRADLSAKFEATLDGGRVSLSDIDARALGMSLTGSASLAGDALEARIEVPAFTPSAGLAALLEAAAPADVNTAAFRRLAFSGQVKASLDTGAYSVDGLRAELLGATLTGGLEAAPQGGGRMVYRGSIKSSRFAPDAFVSAFRSLIAEPIATREMGTLALDTRFVYDTGNGVLTLDPLAAEIFGLSGRGRLSASGLESEPVFQGQVAVERFEPRALFRRFGAEVPVTSDPKALASASVATRFTVDAARGRFENIVLELDSSRITGDFTVEGFQDPKYRFGLAIDDVDADRYLPPSAAEAGAGQATAGDIELPIDALESLDLAGHVAVGRLTLAGMRFDDVATEVAVGAGSATLENAHAKLYGGTFDGGLSVEGRGEAPRLALKGKAAGLTLAPLIQALTGEPANVSGTGSFDLSLAGHGTKVIDNVKTAAGDLSFTLANGSIKGFNLGRSLCAVYNSARKVAQPTKADDVTVYQTIRGTAKVSDGIARSGDLLARTSFMDVTGKGSLGLAEQRLDYDLVAKLTGPIAIQGCDTMQPLIGDSIPLVLKGTLTDPQILPDFSEILRQRLREEAEKNITNRLQQRLQDLLGPR